MLIPVAYVFIDVLHTLLAIRETDRYYIQNIQTETHYTQIMTFYLYKYRYYIQTETHYTQIMTFYVDVKRMIVTGSIDEMQVVCIS